MGTGRFIILLLNDVCKAETQCPSSDLFSPNIYKQVRVFKQVFSFTKISFAPTKRLKIWLKEVMVKTIYTRNINAPQENKTKESSSHHSFTVGTQGQYRRSWTYFP